MLQSQSIQVTADTKSPQKMMVRSKRIGNCRDTVTNVVTLCDRHSVTKIEITKI